MLSVWPAITSLPFPSAAPTTVHFAETVSPGTAYDVVAVALLALATAVVAGVALLTVRAAVRREICVPE